jgi:hypothetical protein
MRRLSLWLAPPVLAAGWCGIGVSGAAQTDMNSGIVRRLVFECMGGKADGVVVLTQ